MRESRKGNFLARTRSTRGRCARPETRRGRGARAGPRAARPAGTATGRGNARAPRTPPRAIPIARGASTPGTRSAALRSYNNEPYVCMRPGTVLVGYPPPVSPYRLAGVLSVANAGGVYRRMVFFGELPRQLPRCHSDFERLHAQLRQRLRRPLKCRRWLCTFLDTDGFRLHAALEQSRVHEDVVSAVHRVE